MTTLTLRVKRLTPDAVLPTRGSSGAAGYDLSACLPDTTLTLTPGERAAIPTGLAIAIPVDTYARVAPRSGLAYKVGVDVLAGVVDYDYRGEVKVIVINLGQEPFTVAHGDRIAQLILERILTPEVEETDDLNTTDRGAAGFGSTGGSTSL